MIMRADYTGQLSINDYCPDEGRFIAAFNAAESRERAVRTANKMQDDKLAILGVTTDKKADGAWGYSSPNHRHIVFCADEGRFNEMRSALIAAQRWVVVGQGVYNNEAPEPCFIMQVDDFYNLRPYLREYMQDQESVLRLGHLKAQNWRDAHLIYGAQRADGPDVRTVGTNDAHCDFIGTFMSVPEEVAKAQTGYTEIAGHYYTVILNPPHNMEERKERANTQLLADAYLELAARNRKYRDKHGSWRRSTQTITCRLTFALRGQVLENGKTIDDKWFQDELRSISEEAVH